MTATLNPSTWETHTVFTHRASWLARLGRTGKLWVQWEIVPQPMKGKVTKEDNQRKLWTSIHKCTHKHTQGQTCLHNTHTQNKTLKSPKKGKLCHTCILLYSVQRNTYYICHLILLIRTIIPIALGLGWKLCQTSTFTFLRLQLLKNSAVPCYTSQHSPSYWPHINDNSFFKSHI